MRTSASGHQTHTILQVNSKLTFSLVTFLLGLRSSLEQSSEPDTCFSYLGDVCLDCSGNFRESDCVTFYKAEGVQLLLGLRADSGSCDWQRLCAGHSDTQPKAGNFL